jgi:multidrug resistance efflux pump
VTGTAELRALYTVGARAVSPQPIMVVVARYGVYVNAEFIDEEAVGNVKRN